MTAMICLIILRPKECQLEGLAHHSWQYGGGGLRDHRAWMFLPACCVRGSFRNRSLCRSSPQLGGIRELDDFELGITFDFKLTFEGGEFTEFTSSFVFCSG